MRDSFMTRPWADALRAEVGPEAPRGFTVPWERPESELGLVLPTDYKEFVYVFGPGELDGFVTVAVPGVANPNVDLVTWARDTMENHRYLVEEERIVEEGLADWPYPPAPQPGFLLPWGMTANGDRLHWATGGDPDGWTVVAEDNGSFELFPFPGGMAEFLTRFLRDELEIPFLPESEPGQPVTFVPWDGSWEDEDAAEPYGTFRPPGSRPDGEESSPG
ncbi:hypothetical protein [Streptomyces sp. GSL17-111]|uniref:hypothetical protein n=1 Tax=Streptomyces sp. GSL17-111 TaxID=3121596 RepID=UPI0030F45CFF